ncbi:MAG: hypothetical protein AAGG48_29575 [Planctomycetota bacterium]
MNGILDPESDQRLRAIGVAQLAFERCAMCRPHDRKLTSDGSSHGGAKSERIASLV